MKCFITSDQNAEGVDELKDSPRKSSDGAKEHEKKAKVEQNTSADLRGKQPAKQAKDNSQSGEPPKENFIHVRARRGQATNSHSLAERVPPYCYNVCYQAQQHNFLQ